MMNFANHLPPETQKRHKQNHLSDSNQGQAQDVVLKWKSYTSSQFTNFHLSRPQTTAVNQQIW